MKPALYMMVGLPGSGKSTKAEEIMNSQENTVVISSDKIRKELYGNESIQGDANEVFGLLEKRVKENLLAGINVVYDATNINSKRRREFLEKLRGINCKHICVLMITDFTMCLINNDSRERKVPYDVISGMYKHFQIPQYKEGWDEIQLNVSRDKLNEYNYDYFIEELSEIPHDNKWHEFSIGNHIKAATKYLEEECRGEIEGTRYEMLINAIKYHDIGKGFVKAFKNAKGEETTVAHYYNHENVSAYMYILFEYDKQPLDILLKTANLIEKHMVLHGKISELPTRITKLLKEISPKELADLILIHEADLAGH